MFRRFALASRASGPELEAMRRRGLVERWGHGAPVRVGGRGAAIGFVLRGGLRDEGGALLTRGDAFGSLGEPHRPEPWRASDALELLWLERDALGACAPRGLGTIADRSAPAWARKLVGLDAPALPLLGTDPRARIAKALLHMCEGAPGRTIALGPRRPSAALLGLEPGALQVALENLRARGAVRARGRWGLEVIEVDALREAALGG